MRVLSFSTFPAPSPLHKFVSALSMWMGLTLFVAFRQARLVLELRHARFRSATVCFEGLVFLHATCKATTLEHKRHHLSTQMCASVKHGGAQIQHLSAQAQVGQLA